MNKVLSEIFETAYQDIAESEKNMPESEMARMRREIDLSNEAAERGLSGMACVASHAVITHKMELIADSFQQQRQVVSERQALEDACAAMNALHEEIFAVAKPTQQQQEDKK